MHESPRATAAHGRSLRVLLCLSLSLLIVTAASAAGYRVEVEQGGVARWDGEGITRCGMDGRAFAPVDDSCWYPIDFRRDPGRIEIARWTSGGIETGWLDIVEREFEKQDIEFPDDTYVHLSQENLDRHYREQSVIRPLLRKDWKKPAQFSIPLGKPAETLPGGGGFAAHRTFNGEPRARHRGTDYAIALGTPVLAVADGDVVLAEEHFFAGLGVYINHGNGLFSLSFHMQNAMDAGSAVEKGAKIGEVGSTGRSTGPHLHLGIHWRGAWIDPEWLYLKAEQIPRVQAAE
ncbi:MAG: M23 family metallopeptidase [Acidobacteriota bacterium]